MQLIQINEEIKDEKYYTIGIDLGTTNSLVAISENGKVRNLCGIIPSIIEIDNIRISSIKRLMGKNYSEAKKLEKFYPFKIENNNGQPQIIINKFKTNPTIISSMILKSLKEKAEEKLGGIVKNAVITVPAYFNDNARANTKMAASLAGLNVIRLLSEPTAASLIYGLDSKEDGKYLIYDLGGGTFDISVLNKNKEIFQIIATKGNITLGGDDFDFELQNLINNKFSNINISLEEAKKIKEKFSSMSEVELSSYNKYKISYSEFEERIKKYIDETIILCKEAISDANIQEKDINGIVLVGGSTRLKLVRKMLSENFSCRIFSEFNPDEIVALGAALQAENIGVKKLGHLLIDLTPLSFGIELMGGIVSKIIERNSPIPISKIQEFTTHKDNQTGMKFHIVQGESEIAENCISLGKFELSGIPPMAAGVARIKVIFSLDADGILSVSAIEEKSGANALITINNPLNLEYDEIKKILFASFDNLENDLIKKKLIEAKIEAESLINLSEKMIIQYENKLDAQYILQVKTIKDKLIASLQKNDINEISEISKSMSEITQKLAVINLEHTMNETIKGKSLLSVEDNFEK